MLVEESELLTLHPSQSAQRHREGKAEFSIQAAMGRWSERGSSDALAPSTGLQASQLPHAGS